MHVLDCKPVHGFTEKHMQNHGGNITNKCPLNPVLHTVGL